MDTTKALSAGYFARIVRRLVKMEKGGGRDLAADRAAPTAGLLSLETWPHLRAGHPFIHRAYAQDIVEMWKNTRLFS